MTAPHAVSEARLADPLAARLSGRGSTVRSMVTLADDGRWYPGELQGYRRREGVWEGDMLWTRDVGMRYVGWSQSSAPVARLLS